MMLSGGPSADMLRMLSLEFGYGSENLLAEAIAADGTVLPEGGVPTSSSTAEAARPATTAPPQRLSSFQLALNALASAGAPFNIDRGVLPHLLSGELSPLDLPPLNLTSTATTAPLSTAGGAPPISNSLSADLIEQLPSLAPLLASGHLTLTNSATGSVPHFSFPAIFPPQHPSATPLHSATTAGTAPTARCNTTLEPQPTQEPATSSATTSSPPTAPSTSAAQHTAAGRKSGIAAAGAAGAASGGYDSPWRLRPRSAAPISAASGGSGSGGGGEDADEDETPFASFVPEEEGAKTKGKGGRKRAPEIDWKSVTDPEERVRLRRMAKNRRTAAASRDRKRAIVDGLQAQVSSLTAANEELAADKARMAAEVAALRTTAAKQSTELAGMRQLLLSAVAQGFVLKDPHATPPQQ